jgi:molybdopterin-guanine dinucleotide biosynthesis protein MobB
MVALLHPPKLRMKRVHIIGGKNHGKTTLVVDLVRELSSRGQRVGTIKHTHHQHELDTPGKDSHQHRTAGAAVVGILTRSASAAFWDATTSESAEATGCSSEPSTADRYAVFARIFSDCDLVLVEGDTQTSAPKIEVWQARLGTPPLAHADESILAVVTDDKIEINTVIYPRSDISTLATRISKLASSWPHAAGM